MSRVDPFPAAPDRDPAIARQALSFGSVAEEYDRVRPGYPAEVVRWALGPGPSRVLDLGAGTGTLTRLLLAQGHEVVAVEPDHLMRERLSVTATGATVLAGSGEEVPLPEAAVDAATVAQAWHWMDEVRASAELARVVRPGGCVVLLWNRREPTDPLSLAVTAAVGRYAPELVARVGADGARHLDPVDLPDPRFTPDGRASIDSSVRYGVADLVTLVSTWSYVALSPRRQAVLDAVREAGQQLAAPDGTVRLAQTVVAFRFRRV